jgi:hypothetical protein
VCTGTAATAQDFYWRWIAYSASLPQNSAASVTVAGNFTGHDLQDFAFLLGGQVALCCCPAIHNSVTPLADVNGATGLTTGPATGLATMPKLGPWGYDALAIAASSGLWQWNGIDTALVAIESGVDWRSVACADLDGVPPLDLVGKVGDNSLRILLRNGSATTTWQRAFTNQVIAHVVPVQWNGAGKLEIAAATEERLWIGTHLATITEFEAANDDCHLARVPMGNRDDLAWWRRSGYQSTLHTVSELGTSQVDAAAIGPVRHLTSGDRTGNGVCDLLVSLHNSGPMRVVENMTTTPGNIAAFDLDPQHIADETPFTTTQPTGYQTFGAPWSGDLNGDGGNDTFVPFMVTDLNGVSASTVRVRLNMFVSLERPRLGPVTITGNSTHRTYSIQVSTFGAPQPPTGSTHLELLAFAGRARSGALATMPEGVKRIRVAPGASSIGFTIDVTADMPRGFVGAVRWIEVDQNGVTVHVRPPSKFTFATDGLVNPYVQWRDARMTQIAAPTQFVWVPEYSPSSSVYLLRPLSFDDQGGIYTSHSGDEEPPDLPPPPPVPPRPPTPPPPPGG